MLGFTALGLAEIVRPRVHPPLHELLAGPLASGLAALRRLAREAAARPASAPALRAAPAVVAALHEDGAALADLARRTGRPLILCSDPALAAVGLALSRSDRAQPDRLPRLRQARRVPTAVRSARARCAQIDLGRWLTEQYRLPGAPAAEGRGIRRTDA